MDQNISKNRTLWKFPWNYKESFIVVLDLIVLSFILEALFQGEGIKLPSLPYSIISFMILLFLTISLFLLFRTNKIIQWLSSVPAAMASITLYAIVSLFMGIIPQNPVEEHILLKLTGISHIGSSWLILFSSFFLLTVVGFTICKRMFPFKKRNIGFLMNHAGIWIIIASASLGTGDLQRLRIQLYEGKEFNNVAIDDNKQMYKLPFSLQLVDFEIEEYNPKLLIFNPITNSFIHQTGKSFQMIDNNFSITISNFRIDVIEFIKYAKPHETYFIQSDMLGAVPAAKITITDLNSNNATSGWITSGGFGIEPTLINLSPELSISLAAPEPKEYSSLLVIKDAQNNMDTISVIVNKPYSVDGYNLYQMSYNDKMGKWSDYSIIEVISDPWLPIVYFGFLLLFIGSIFMLWWGRKIYDVES
ncbi:MAG: hypothetical protein PHU27_02230 [Salinivirgaceae bacterium]|nr:hypothetical protein [Salinivirgaceae bacterium]MDD4746856.1 hypothetical protein [Salinivirgaceae bacterium]MDY0279075.1 hypothetical protein [Salinivirgaceae bacterium]